MFKFRHLLLLLALASPFASAMKAVFWQPQLRDSSVTAARWQALMADLRHSGFDTLVLQWTAYGDAFTDDAQRAALQQRADDARAAGLKVIVGLHGDPEFFQRQAQSGAARTHYLARLRVADIIRAKAWQGRVDGWYISAEIDDLNWRSRAVREQLVDWLTSTRRQLAGISPVPVYISSFFAGNMTPDGYRQLVADVAGAGIKVWVQDGRGVDKLTAEERQRYLTASAGCGGSAPASGVVYEVFRMLPGSAFHAAPLSAPELSARMKQGSACGKDSVYFSLRYLPAARGVLGAG